jgi:hypothetical protein
VLTAGDLVKIHDNTFKYFAGKLAIVDHVAHRDEYYNEEGKIEERTYYLITLADLDSSHVFPEDELALVSKAQNKNG